nr:nadh kinase [Quercus suber]
MYWKQLSPFDCDAEEATVVAVETLRLAPNKRSFSDHQPSDVTSLGEQAQLIGNPYYASHFMDDSVPVVGVNSDPTQIEEVEQFSNEFDANRSTGHLCAATVNNFQQVLDDILEGRKVPSKLSRISVHVKSHLLSTYALNDILIAHPCPATLSRFSFKIKRENQPFSPMVNCRSSGLRVSTASGSTAAMLSAGGFPMPILSQDLQYMVREPIFPGAASSLVHGLVKSDQYIETTWFSKEELYTET